MISSRVKNYTVFANIKLVQWKREKLLFLRRSTLYGGGNQTLRDGNPQQSPGKPFHLRLEGKTECAGHELTDRTTEPPRCTYRTGRFIGLHICRTALQLHQCYQRELIRTYDNKEHNDLTKFPQGANCSLIGAFVPSCCESSCVRRKEYTIILCW